MQKKHIRKFIPLLVILLLVGCWLFNEFVIRRPAGKVVVAEYEDYTILKRKDQYYLRLDDSKYVRKDSSGNKLPQTHATYSPPTFRSAQDMRDSILKGKLTEHNLGYIWQEFSWDGHGDYLIPDPYNITIPKDPYGTQLYWVHWAVDYLYFYFSNSLGYIVEFYSYPLNKEHSVRSQTDKYVEWQKEYICKIEQVEERDATVYYVQQNQVATKFVVYDINTEGKELRIMEKYPSWDSKIPSYTEFWGIENETYFRGTVKIKNASDAKERLSIEFLQSLGISPEPAR